ncbi:MAG: energy-coupling factor transporter transmembrane component T, partial [Anaerolineaceae bacterium]|nr:energy-coupling factor transporter transmembrane component T [Anaerolineaceae bacterium]
MSNSEHSLQFFESDSLLHRIYPLVKLIWVFVIALGLFLYQTPIPGLVMFGVVILMALTAGRVPLSRLLGSSRVIFGLAFLLMLFHFFANPGVAIYRLGPLTLTDEGLRQGPVFFFRLSVVVLSSFILI